MPLAATRVDLEIIILSEVSLTKKNITYVKNLKNNDTNELIYKTQTDSQKTNTWLPKGLGWGEGQIGKLELTYTHDYI